MALNYQAAVNITATYDGRGVNQAQSAFQKFDGTLKGTIGGLRGLKSAFGALAAAFAIKEMAQFAKNVIDIGDNLNDLRQKTGIGVQALSDLKAAAEQNGLEFGQFESALKKFSVTLVKAQAGSKEAAAGFRAIGLSAGSFKSTDDALFAIAEKFRNAEDGAAKAAVAVALFGKTGADLIPLLNQGTEGIKGMGAQMSDEFAKQADTFNDNLNIMKNNLISFGASILEKVLPYVNKFLEVLGRVRVGTFGLRLEKPAPELAADLTGTGKSDKLPGKTKIDPRGLGGEDHTKKLESEKDAIARLGEQLAELGKEYELETKRIGMSTAAYEKEKIAIDEKSKATQASINFSEENKKSYQEVTDKIIDQKKALIDLREEQKKSFGASAKEALKQYKEAANDTAAQTKQVFSAAFSGLEDALVDFVKTGKLSFQDLASTISEMLIRIGIQKAIAVGISAAGFANGGIMTSDGPVALKKYASGGIANSPQLAMFGEGSTPEAFVPLPDGRSIPVSMKGGGGNTSVVVNVNIANTGAVEKDEVSDTEKGKQLGTLISSMISQELVKQKRPGGLLA